MKPPEIKTALSGLSTAPNAPPNGSLFGGQGQQMQQLGQSGGLFGGLGGTTQQQNQPGGGLLGGTNNNAQPAGGLFGAASGSNQQQGQPAGGLFGGAGGNAQPTGGLFGNASNATQNQPTGGLFGGAQQQTQPSGGLFGNTGQNQQQQPSSGLFGQQATNIAPQSTFLSPQNAGQTNAQTGGGLFGASNNQQGGSSWNQNNPLLPKSAFGGNPAAMNNALNTGTSSLFGQTPSQNTGLGTSLLGQPQQSQQPYVVLLLTFLCFI